MGSTLLVVSHLHASRSPSAGAAHQLAPPTQRPARPLLRGAGSLRQAGRTARAARRQLQPTAAGGSPPPPGAATDSRHSSSWQLLAYAAAQTATLTVALAGLILLPAHLSGRLAAAPAPALTSYTLYLLFFASGTIARMLRHGALAPRSTDAQLASTGSRVAFALFVLAVPAGHYLAWWDASLAAAYAAVGCGPATRLAVLWALQAVGLGLMLGGWALNAAAASALGKVRCAGGPAAWHGALECRRLQLSLSLCHAFLAGCRRCMRHHCSPQAYDRLVHPEQLVTSGPYRLVQHPIYLSYMLLFVGHCIRQGRACERGALRAGAALLRAVLASPRLAGTHRPAADRVPPASPPPLPTLQLGQSADCSHAVRSMYGLL